MWDFWNVEYSGCVMFEMWDFHEAGCSECGCEGGRMFGMQNIQEVGY